ncbi:MAG: T9SS type A sorting domain-containing protein [bacterium]|nr:T9SS type A sorting domain-containing protein [bacterium]
MKIKESKKSLVKFIFVSVLVGTFLFVSNVCNANVLVNPDAETGDIQGWADVDNAWSAAAEITPHGGSYFFWPAKLDISYTFMYQDVDVSMYASGIDSGNTYFHLSGWLANWDQYPHDQATLAIEALDAGNQQLLYSSRSHRSPVWTYYQTNGQIPAGSRTLRVNLIATRYVGYDNDAYFDDLCLDVDTNAPDIFVTVTSQGGVSKVAVDSTLQLSAVTVGGVDTSYIWTSSFNAIATVDTGGLVTAHTAGRVTIQAEGTITHASGYFELVAYSPDYVIFINPQTGEEWESKKAYDITWELEGSISSGVLYYNTGGGSSWIKIDTIQDLSVLEYSWTIPDTNKTLNDCMVKMVWNGGESVSSLFSIIPTEIGVEEHNNSFSPICLFQNKPNPFINSTKIEYSITKGDNVNISVYNVSGQKIVTLVNGFQNKGLHSVNWSGEDYTGNRVTSGIYFYKLQAGKYTSTKKMYLF